MRASREELTLTSALSDPLVRAMMVADKIDPLDLESMLTRIAATVAPGGDSAGASRCGCGLG